VDPDQNCHRDRHRDAYKDLYASAYKHPKTNLDANDRAD
jgi:hypothetical protein